MTENQRSVVGSVPASSTMKIVVHSIEAGTIEGGPLRSAPVGTRSFNRRALKLHAAAREDVFERTGAFSSMF